MPIKDTPKNREALKLLTQEEWNLLSLSAKLGRITINNINNNELLKHLEFDERQLRREYKASIEKSDSSSEIIDEKDSPKRTIISKIDTIDEKKTDPIIFSEGGKLKLEEAINELFRQKENIINVDKRIAELSKENRKLREEMVCQTKQISELTNRNIKLNDDIASLRREVTSQGRRISLLEDKEKKNDKEIQTLKSDNESLKNNNKILREEFFKLLKEVKKHNNEEIKEIKKRNEICEGNFQLILERLGITETED